MALIKNIHHLYKPVQPTVNRQGDVAYTEFPPHSGLQEYIYCYWHLQTVQKLEEDFKYSVVADGCIDIFFELDNPENSFVMGFCKTVTEFSLNTCFNYFGIRFLPAAFTRLFRIDASALSNSFESLLDVIPSIAKHIAGQAGDTGNVQQVKIMLDSYFLKLVSNHQAEADPRFYNALAAIIDNRGIVSIEAGLDTGISPRQLRRMFEFYVGTNAKTFSRVVRFQNVLNNSHSMPDDKAYLDLGYYDQAHFIKEFKDFYGTTPGKAMDK